MRFLILSLILVNVCVSKSYAFDPETYKFKYKQEIFFDSMKAIDGDTLVNGKWKIRLATIDAPEIGQKCRDAHDREYKCGVVAKEHLQKLLDNSVNGISCVLLKRDKYNRIIAGCRGNGVDFETNMLRSGQAIYGWYGRDPHEDYAKSNKIGIWSGKFVSPYIWRKSNS